MQIILTSDSWADTSTLLRDILVPFANALNIFFVSESYGDPDKFMAVVVAVDSDAVENAKISKQYHKIGNDRHPITGIRSKYISFAIPIDPTDLLLKTKAEVSQLICDALIQKLGEPDLKIPKAFDYSKFSVDLIDRLEILKHVGFD